MIFSGWLADFVEQYRGRLRGFAYRRIPPAADAEDVLSNALLRALSIQDRAPEADHLRKSWFYRILQNVSREATRAERVVLHDVDEYADVVSDRSQQPEVEFEQRELQQAVYELPLQLRRAFILTDIEGLPYSEVAKRERCSVSTASERAMAARRQLEAALSLGALSGRVTSSTGTAIQGARVLVRGVHASVTKRTRTTKEGKFTISMLLAGWYAVDVQARDYEVWRRRAEIPPAMLTMDVVLESSAPETTGEER